MELYFEKDVFQTTRHGCSVHLQMSNKNDLKCELVMEDTVRHVTLYVLKNLSPPEPGDLGVAAVFL